MSLYQLQKLIYHVNRDVEHREHYRQNPGAFTKKYDLTEEERVALLNVDVRALYTIGVHSLLLRPFTLLNKVSNEDYAQALKGLACLMPIVFACAASHAPGMTAWTEAAPKEQSEKFLGCYRQLGERLAAAKPDTIVAFTVEHWANFFLNSMPTFCIGRANHYDGPIEEWLRIPKARVPGDAELSAQLIDACLDSGFDPLFSDELLFDHATFLPLHFLNSNMALPVVPVIINTLSPPMPTAKRCFAFGEFLGQVLQRSEKRIALIATGGLSHWPGEAQHGRINIPFDKKFLDNLLTGDHHQLTAYTHDEINSDAGSGGHEIRTWIALAGAVQSWKAELIAYEPVVPWATGCGLVQYFQ